MSAVMSCATRAFLFAIPLNASRFWRGSRPSNIRPSTSRRSFVAEMAPVLSRPALKKNALGSSGLLVTEVCLGTMTWGVQNTEADAHEQLDYAIKERLVNFLDTAEIYPVPSSAPGQKPGTTEEYIGTWLEKNPEWRERIIIASKVMGFGPQSKTVANRTVPTSEEQDARLDPASIRAACEASLRRLRTDYIDLYQLHWPDRYVPLWGGRVYNPSNERDRVPFIETARGIKALIDEGKIRHWGLSNETTFGVCELVRAADELGMPRPVTIQNQFCLLNRSFEGELAEACAPNNYNIGLLPWSVLGGGALTGKYTLDADGNINVKGMEKTRFVLFKEFQGRFANSHALSIINQYSEVAKEAGISLATLAQKWCATRWYIPSTIIGATTMVQLKENIDAFSVELSEDILKKIDRIHLEEKDPYVSL